MRVGLVIFLAYDGLLKMNEAGAAFIQPFVESSPVLSWLYQILDVTRAGKVIGGTEIAAAALVALRLFSPLAGFVGSILAALIFAITVSFLFTTPALFVNEGALVPVATPLGVSLLKDLVLLGAALWSASESRRAMSVSMD